MSAARCCGSSISQRSSDRATGSRSQGTQQQRRLLVPPVIAQTTTSPLVGSDQRRLSAIRA
jgi:hypothetical protein